MATWKLDYTPSEKQRVFHAVKTRQILYGGAAGGGKSHALRMDGILTCLQNPGCQGYLFRRTYPELKDNHLIPIQQMQIPPEVAVWRETDRKLLFHNGSFMQFCFAEDLNDIFKYQGSEMHWLGIDEGALFLEDQLKFLRTRVRLGGFAPAQADVLPRIAIGSNPGGPGHNFLRRVFIDQAPPMHVFHDQTTKTKLNPGWTSVYIPARMDDNPHLDTQSYEGSFTALSLERARALRDGDWDVISGAAFSMLDRTKHMLRPFRPPRHWTHVMAMDWGTAKPFSVGWYAVSEGALLKESGRWPEVYLAPGAIVRFAEWYGWNGEADAGCRMSAAQVAKGILDLEAEMELPPIDVRVSDPQMWASQDGPSPQQNMRVATQGRIVLRQGRRDRKANYTTMVSRLVGEQDRSAWRPGFYVTENCRHFWRTVPSLILDDVEPDKGPATRHQEDHCFVAGTPVQTLSGVIEIENIIAGDEVWTPAGWRRVRKAWCSGVAEIWLVEIEHKTIAATGNHPFLTARGVVRLDELQFGDRLLVSWPSSSTAKSTGFVAAIISVAAGVFTSWSGRIIMAPFRRAATFITSTATPRTTISATSNAETQKTPHSLPARSRPLTPNESRIAPRAFHIHAVSAAKRAWRKLVYAVYARFAASSASSDLPILAITRPGRKSGVYNLAIDGCPMFTVHGGVIVLNCYDEVAFALGTWSKVTTQADRELEEVLEMGREMTGGLSSDPYSVRRRR